MARVATVAHRSTGRFGSVKRRGEEPVDHPIPAAPTPPQPWIVSRRVFLKAMLGTSSVVLLAACSPASPAPAPPATTAPAPAATPTTAAKPAVAPAAPATMAPASKSVDEVKFGGVVSMNYVPVFVGVEKGIFLKHGVDLKVKLLATGQEANQALQAGETQFTAPAPSNAPPAYEQGITFVNVVCIQNDGTTPRSDSPVSLHAHKDAGIGPSEFEKLKGKRIGLASGSTGEQYLRAILDQKGIAAKDVTIVNLPSSNWKSALETKQVDVISSWEPFGTQMGQVPGAIKIVRGGGFIGYSISFAPSTKFHDEKTDVVRRAVYGLAEAAWYTRMNRGEAAEIATRWLEGLDKPTAIASLEVMPYDPRITKHVIQGWVDGMKDLVDQKKLRQVIPTEKLFNTSFIEQAQKENPAWFADLKPVA
jgi:ABC-type nitrate/sulfonate/bicarbonate transport system substrate-binding protein